MNLNYKLFFKYILLNTNFLFLKYLNRNDKNTNLLLNTSNFYYLILHFKLSSLFYSSQLVDIFAYELNLNSNKNNNDAIVPFLINNIIVYNFHSILLQQRFFLFLVTNNFTYFYKNFSGPSNIISISEIFANSNWLEREIAELHGIFFDGKKDLRNLMLQYGDTSAPMQKSFPSIGVREIYYDTISDNLIQVPTTIQF